MSNYRLLALAICFILTACSGGDGDSEIILQLTPQEPSAELQTAKQAAIKVIQQLPNLSISEINQFKQQVEQATTQSEINNIKQAAQAKSDADSFIYKPAVFQNPASLKDYCAAPRQNNRDKPGSVLHENLWLRAWSHATYLWYQEVPDINPKNYTPVKYFAQLKASDAKDHFHYAIPTAEYEGSSGIDNSASIDTTTAPNLTATATEYGYGLLFHSLTVAKVEPYSPAAISGLQRGDLLAKVNDFDLRTAANYSEEELKAKIVAVVLPALYPANDGHQHSNEFIFLRNNQEIAVTLSAKTIDTYAVPTVKLIEHNNQNYGYILFNSHVARAQQPLIDAITSFKQQGVTNLILDLRYNGGGLLALASQLAYMSSDNASANQVFAQSQYNTNPKNPLATGITNTNFLNKQIDYASSQLTDTNLPSLNTSNVFVLTTEQTCSASEALINGLRGVGVNVIQIGATTCGKPYGFIPEENCDTTYLTIQFKLANAKGESNYSNGFTPTAASGCKLEEDFKHQLGDEHELLLSKALNYSTAKQCNTNQLNATGLVLQSSSSAAATAIKTIQLPQPDAWQNNAFIVPITKLP